MNNNQQIKKISIAAVITSSLFLTAQKNSYAKPVKSACYVYAQVVSSNDPNYPELSDLCMGEVLKPMKPDSEVLISCWNRNTGVKVHSTSDISNCKVATIPRKICTLPVEMGCIRMRGDNSKEPLVIEPLSETILNQPTKLSWLSIDKASHYLVMIRTDKDEWDNNTTNTTVPWPKNISLSPGNLCRISIRAYQGEKLLSISESYVNTLDTQDRSDLQQYLNNVSKINPLSSRLKTTIAVYNFYNLKDEALKYLNNVKKQDSSVIPTINVLKQSIYLDSGIDFIRANSSAESKTNSSLFDSHSQRYEPIRVGPPQ